MCFKQDMPEVKVPVTSAPAAPASPPPKMETDFTDTDKAGTKIKKKAKGKKKLRYDDPSFNPNTNKNGLQIPSGN